MNNSVTQTIEERLVRITAGPVRLVGDLNLPEGSRAVVLFAHGSGSSRRSSRNRYVARLLNEAKLATLLIDLLTPDEDAIDERTAQLRFNIDLLAERLVDATAWLTQDSDTRYLSIGYFGASTGAAAALVAAAERPDLVSAVVSRGGRPDLAGSALMRVQAPTLLIVGGNDVQLIQLNRAALAQLRCEKQLVIVPGAAHLFEEPGALDQVARLAREWFTASLSRQCDTPLGAAGNRHERGASRWKRLALRLARNHVPDDRLQQTSTTAHIRQCFGSAVATRQFANSTEHG